MKLAISNSQRYLRIILVIIFSLIVSGIVLFYREKIESYSQAGYLAVLLLSCVTHLTVLVPGPTYIVAITMGAILNPFLVGVLMGVGAALGESFGYYLGRFGFSDQIRNPSLEKKLKNKAFLTIFLLAVIPNPFFDLGAILAGSVRMKYFNFFVATASGKAIRFLLVSILSNKFFN